MSDSQDPSLGQDEHDDVPFGSSGLPPLAIVGLIAAAVPFFVKFHTLSTSSVGGVTTYSYSEPTAMIGGLVALLCGLFLGVKAFRKQPVAPKPVTWLIVVALVGLGAWHALHGFGIILPTGVG